MKSFYCYLFLLLPILSFAQKQPTINGHVIDASTGETLIGATVYCSDLKIGTGSNEYGFYSLKLPKDEVELIFSFIGYASQTLRLRITQDTIVDINLKPGNVLTEVVVSAESNKEVLNSTQMSIDKITMKEARLLPALFGEVDIIKTMQLKPGIKSGGEGSSGIVVRGGSPDQNLFILDEAIIYNPSHLFGFFSTFNSDAIKDVQLYKGGFPAQYGGRLSSVIDVKLKEGNRRKFSGTGGIGLISSRLTLEAPIQKDKSSFIISGRRTYADIFTRIINKANEDNEDFDPIPDYSFYDLNFKVNFDLGPKDKLFASAYLGRDFFHFAGSGFDFNFDWGNTTASLRWNRVYTPKLFSNTTATVSDFNYVINNTLLNVASFELSSGIRDYNLKTDFFYTPNNNHSIRFGINYTFHQFELGRLEGGDDDGTFSFEAGQEFEAHEFAGYFSDDFEINDKLKINGGVRFSGFYNGKFYGAVEPRVSAKYSISDKFSVKGSYTHMAQYIHLVANSALSLPTDLWYPSDETVKPQRSNQVAAGVVWSISDQLLFSNEAYYKWSSNQVDFKDGARLFVNDELEKEFVFGEGTSYGNEWYLEKKLGKLTGWASYTLSWANRQFPDINDGNSFSPRYDTRHDLSLVAIWEISHRLSLTGTWIYSSGSPTTIPNGRYVFQDLPGLEAEFAIPIYPERTSFRLAAYHRLDLGLVWKFFPRWGSSDLTLSVYNVYDRRNAFFIAIETSGVNDEGVPTGYKASQVSLFPILPSITFNFKF